jgi:hypothetical protein
MEKVGADIAYIHWFCCGPCFVLTLLILLLAILDGRICNQEPLGDVVDGINTNS